MTSPSELKHDKIKGRIKGERGIYARFESAAKGKEANQWSVWLDEISSS